MTAETYAGRPWPTRGLVFTRNHKGRAWTPAHLVGWLRLSRRVFKTRKCDVSAPPQDAPILRELLEAAPELDLRLSWRCEGNPPADLKGLAAAGLLDVCAVVRGTSRQALMAWGEACEAAGLALRLMLAPPFDPAIEPEAWAQACRQSGARAVSIAAWDPFVAIPVQRNARQSQAAIAYINQTAEALSNIEADVYVEGLPFCHVSEANRAICVNAPQRRRNPQHYEDNAYAFAERLWRLSPPLGAKAAHMLLGLHSTWPNPIDAKLLPWIVDCPWLFVRLWALHKLTRHIRLPFFAQRAIEPRPKAETATAAVRFAAHEACGACCFRYICSRLPAGPAGAYNGIEAAAIPGEPMTDPVAFLPEPIYRDAVDAEIAAADHPPRDLVQRARELLESVPPTHTIGPYDYEVEGQWSQHSAGNIRWFSWTHTEKISTPLPALTPPCMAAVTLGDGIAQLAGFNIGRYARIVAPMTGFGHRIALYVAADGRYVLLRDGRPVRPVEFAGDLYVPLRIGSRFVPGISLWNIDGSITTQGLSLWEDRPEEPPDKAEAAPPLVSFVVVCTRFARRLESVLRHLAHLRDEPGGGYEILVAYVPGLDATLDVVESLARIYPGLRIHALPFTPELATAKGFMINECVRVAQGEWVALLDADSLVPPNLLDVLRELPDDVVFAVPDGRKMLSPETTAAILLGERTPWEEWETLLKSAGEYRYDEAVGIPIGFLQAVRRRCWGEVQYIDSRNFDGADYSFGTDMLKKFGPAFRMSGMPVLHLDHGGSQWYGTAQHR